MTRTPLESLRELSNQADEDGLLSIIRRLNRRQKRQRKTDRFLDRLREPGVPRRGKTGTLIIAIKCNDGIVIGSDRRIVRGTESQVADKVKTLDLGGRGVSANVLFAAEGLTGIRDDFFLLLDGEIQRRKGVDTLYEVKVIVEDIIHELTTRYSERIGESHPIGVAMGGLERLTSGDARLYYIHADGYGELASFVCTGHGGPYAQTLSKFLCDVNSLTVIDAAARAAFIISWVSAGELDSTVGGKPQGVRPSESEPYGRDHARGPDPDALGQCENPPTEARFDLRTRSLTSSLT